ncbi:MAG: cytochrome c maturation protein CcmE [Anderseniella sp.]|nr:cytochrome c maturation protein CcmE [Anderseniella sp.]
MSKKKKRGALIGAGLGILGVAAGLVLYALSDTITFFYTPSDVVAKSVEPGTRMRLGGLVADGSVIRGQGKEVGFTVTDTDQEIVVSYVGILPDLFREGQGVIAEGVLQPGGKFKADTVLAKHDENYMPREVADALKAKGVWKDGEGMPQKGSTQ